MAYKYYDATITDEDLDIIKQDIIEAKKQGMLEGHLIELPYIIRQKGEVKEWVSVDIFPDFESKRDSDGNRIDTTYFDFLQFGTNSKC
jgi:hypothetical protein